jgi:hypothetical protein
LTHQLREEVTDPAIRNIRHKRVERESPSQWVHQGLLQLIHLEVLVSNTLLVDPDSFDGQDSVTRLQPSSIELVVRHDEQEDNAQTCCETAIDQKYDLPGCDCCAMLAGPDRDAVGDEAAEDLTEAVEREPKAGTGALLLLRVPL